MVTPEAFLPRLWTDRRQKSRVLRGRGSCVAMVMVQPQASFNPHQLAAWLSTWALRREKRLELLDPRRAKIARSLSLECARLDRERVRPADWHRDWVDLKRRVVGLLEESRGSGVHETVRTKPHSSTG